MALPSSTDSLNPVRVGGIKLSTELSQFSCSSVSHEEGSITSLLAGLAHQHINIPFLCHTHSQSCCTTVFCVENAHATTVQGLLAEYWGDADRVEVRHAVGTITVFPHRNSIGFLGMILRHFGTRKIPVYAHCTSISACSFNTDYTTLPDAVQALEEIVTPPENHSPYRQEFTVQQIDR